MLRLVFLIFINFSALNIKADTVKQLILNKRTAVTISPVRLYADSMYAKSTETLFTEGEFFEVIGETKYEHYDNSQNQTFKWYHVRNMNGVTGWLFGDNLAVAMPEHLVDFSLRSIFKKEMQFDNGFEKSLVWVASTEGHDEKYKDKPFLNPPYKEYYIVVTNERGKCVMINYAALNESGKKDIQNIYFQDVTDNKIDEIILETNSLPIGYAAPERLLEIYGFKAGTLTKLFEEQLSLNWEDGVPAPSFSKFVDIDANTIRIAYVDYVPCDKFSLSLPTDVRTKSQERCLEYVTYSFMWDKHTKAFKTLYKESRSAVCAEVTKKTGLKGTPSVGTANQLLVEPNERFQVIKHFETIVKNKNGEKKAENWLYIKHPSGTFGYLKADNILFKNAEHARILEQYYEKTPLMKQDWSSDESFILVKK